MELLNNNIIVAFDENHNKDFVLGDLVLERPETWLYEELSTGETKYQKQLDLRQTKPQIATIKVSNKRYPELKVGDRVFTHFLAFDNSEDIEVDGANYKTIALNSIFFKITDDGLEMMDDVYLGERVMEEDQVSPNGIILTPYFEKAKESTIKITHIPKESPDISIGDEIITIDDNQYELDFLGKKYIKLNTWYIVAKN